MSLDIAVKIAAANTAYPRWPLGCVVTKGGAVQSVGWSILKGDPAMLDDHSNCSVHAEMHALRQMRQLAHGCVMYVARINRSGQPALAKPCGVCQRAISRAGVKKVVYTVDGEHHGVWRPSRRRPHMEN
jgi:pyrimidine deaminase RibD-like protein